MSEPFLAEIRIFAGNFAPRGWTFCEGQILSIAQNTALFSLLGTTFGGDGRTNFGVPNLKGSAPMHPGRGPGLTSRRLGERGGAESSTLSTSQMPNHGHTMGYSNETDDPLPSPPGNTLARSSGAFVYQQSATSMVALSPDAVGQAGGSQAHTNMQPFLTLNYIIALQGTFPSRSIDGGSQIERKEE
jgi:microcystin-dependent protein